jgi:Tat protein translocase TatB subunit
MPNLGFQELLVIMLLVLFVFGPRKLPEISRQVGRALRTFRQMSTDVKGELKRNLALEEMTREIRTGLDIDRPARTKLNGRTAPSVPYSPPTLAAGGSEPAVSDDHSAP